MIVATLSKPRQNSHGAWPRMWVKCYGGGKGGSGGGCSARARRSGLGGCGSFLTTVREVLDGFLLADRVLFGLLSHFHYAPDFDVFPFWAGSNSSNSFAMATCQKRPGTKIGQVIFPIC